MSNFAQISVILTKVYPSLLADGKIVYSEQKSTQTKRVFGMEIDGFSDEENFSGPRMTITPKGKKTEGDVRSQWLNDMSAHIDLSKPEYQIAYICELSGTGEQSLEFAYDSKGSLRSKVEIKRDFLLYLGYEDAPDETETRDNSETA